MEMGYASLVEAALASGTLQRSLDRLILMPGDAHWDEDVALGMRKDPELFAAQHDGFAHV